MRRRSSWLLGLGASLLLSGRLLAQQICPSPIVVSPQPIDPKAPIQAAPVQAPTVPTSMPFSELAQAGTEAGGETFNPAMFGDLGIMGRLNSTVGSGGSSAQIPVFRRGAFRSADNASPLPSDRIYVFYSYFNEANVNGADTVDLHRETIGFEKTLLGNRMSIGMHVPFLQVANGYPGLDNAVMGDLSVITKWAFLYDEESGSGVSTGTVVTFPTGQGPRESVDGRRINTTYVQPYVGWVLNSDLFYAQGFTGAMLSLNTNQNEPTLLSNSVGIGAWLLRNRCDALLRGIAIPVEVHVLTPLDRRGETAGMVADDLMAVVSGVNFVFTRNSTLGFAAGVPVLGPRYYNIEGQAFLNLRF